MSESVTSRNEEWLLALLRRGLSDADPVPSDVTEFAKIAFSWRDIDAELAELEYDSIDEDVPTGVRSSATARLISFQAGQWLLDVEYDVVNGRLIGHISPQTSYRVELHSSGTSYETESDEAGRFQVDGVSPGPVSLVLRFADGQGVKTQWVVL